ncbi:hypothetical protein C8Q79DRAFT_1007296 [Trametes meyenii]|nr:hypothetical protein C8Q79DRAFT_1007296 [Trametes meyenii]
MSPPTAAGPPLLPHIPSLNNKFGALLLGSFAGLILYGLTLHQSYRYFRLYPDDAVLVKTFVISILVIETVHTVACIHSSYWYLVTNYFNPLALLGGVCFFARRVYLISRKYRLLVAVAVTLSVVALGFASASTAEAVVKITFEGFEHVTWLDSIGFGAIVISDVLTTSVLIIVLKRSRTGIRRTDHIVDSLILYAVNTGLLTGIFNMLSLFFALVAPTNMIYIGVSIVATKVYANSLLAVLNTRRSLAEREAAVTTNGGAIGLSGLRNATRLTAAELWNVPQASEDSGTVIELKVSAHTESLTV